MAGMLRMARQIARGDSRRDCRLSLSRITFMPITAIHPGEHLAEELETLGMSAAELARKIGVPTNRFTQILHGTRAIPGDTALRLGHFFGERDQRRCRLQARGTANHRQSRPALGETHVKPSPHS